jgi:hypothetical protein
MIYQGPEKLKRNSQQVPGIRLFENKKPGQIGRAFQ